MISNTSICKTYLFKFILTLFLTLLNSLSFLNSEKKYKLKCFNISQKYLYKKKKNAPTYGAFSSKGALGNGLIGLGLGLPCSLVVFGYKKERK